MDIRFSRALAGDVRVLSEVFPCPSALRLVRPFGLSLLSRIYTFSEQVSPRPQAKKDARQRLVLSARVFASYHNISVIHSYPSLQSVVRT